MRKYLFDRSFDDGLALGVVEGDKPPAPTYTEQQLETVREQAYESGYAAGQKASEETQRQQMNTLLGRVEQKLNELNEAAAQQWREQMGHLQCVAVAVARKIMPAYAARYGCDEIQAVIAQVLTEIGREPRLVIRVGEAQFDAISAKIADITARQAYAGKVVVLGEPDLGAADCRIEWADGGIERDSEKLWQDINRIVEEAQAGSLPASPNTDPSMTNAPSGETL